MNVKRGLKKIHLPPLAGMIVNPKWPRTGSPREPLRGALFDEIFNIPFMAILYDFCFEQGNNTTGKINTPFVLPDRYRFARKRPDVANLAAPYRASNSKLEFASMEMATVVSDAGTFQPYANP